MTDEPEQYGARRAGRRQWLAVGLVALFLLLVYVGGYFATTRIVDPPGLNRVRIFPSRAFRVIWSPLHFVEHRATGIGAAIDLGDDSAQIEDEWEVIVIDTKPRE